MPNSKYWLPEEIYRRNRILALRAMIRDFADLTVSTEKLEKVAAFIREVKNES